MLGVVLEQRGHHLAVEGCVPGVAVVIKLHVLLLLLVLGVPHVKESRCQVHGACGELVGAAEGLVVVEQVLHRATACGVELCQVVYVELALEVARGVLIVAYACLVVALHLHYAHRVDALVHAYGVFPVVGALRVLGVVLYAHGLAGTHVAQHDLLLHAAYLCAWGVLHVAHLLYAVA